MADKKLNTESLDVRKSEILSDLFDLVSAALMSKAQACGAACDCNLSISSGPRGAETHSHRPLIVLPRLILVVCSSPH